MKIIGGLFRGAQRPSGPATFSVDPVTLAAAKQVERGGHCSCLSARTRTGKPQVPILHVESQDDAAPGWPLLLRHIAEADVEGVEIFEPLAAMAADKWPGIVTLPSELGALSRLKKLRLYGSHLCRLPPELGRLAALEDLDIYTSYSLHWLPYEVTRCMKLRQTRMSTRGLYGNAKTLLPFPRLSGLIDGLTPSTCSVCDQPFGESGPQMFWTTQRIGTDIAPLLIHSCSATCLAHVPDAPQGYHARPHRGGGGVGMPDPNAC